jgi:hypothetical protein
MTDLYSVVFETGDVVRLTSTREQLQSGVLWETMDAFEKLNGAKVTHLVLLEANYQSEGPTQ